MRWGVFRKKLSKALEEKTKDKDAIKKFIKCLHYQTTDTSKPESYRKLKKKILKLDLA